MILDYQHRLTSTIDISPTCKGEYLICLFDDFPFLYSKTCSESPEELLIYARQKDLRISQLTEPSQTYETVLPVMNVKSVAAIAWESTNDSLYWADVDKGEINRAYINGTYQYNVIKHNTSKFNFMNK